LFFQSAVKADVRQANSEIPGIEKALNFGAVYVVQWGFYLTTQKKEIDKHGSFDNWLHNPTRPHPDKDSFDYNLVKHSLVGNYYYLFYRSRGYSERSSFLWSMLSSLAFEFTIETVTEPPSFQDIYQTPVFGTVLGVGSEKLSLYLHSLDTRWGHVLGYIFNPFSLLPSTSNFIAGPIIQKDHVAMRISWEF
jgi:hypothetical protein